MVESSKYKENILSCLAKLKKKILLECAGSGWDEVSCLHSSLYDAVFYIGEQNSADNTPMF